MNKINLYIFLAILSTTLTNCTREGSTRVPITYHFFAPNSFTPNNDGLNDSFRPIKIAGVDMPVFHISIYNGNLQKVYESDDVYASWSPGPDATIMPDGPYTYQITYVASTDSIHYESYITTSGVNLLR